MTIETPAATRLLMLLATLLFALALAACDVTEPNNSECDTPAGADDAAQFIAGEWQNRLGVELPVELPPIRWFEGDCMSWQFLPEFYDCDQGRYFDGSAWFTEEIQLLAKDRHVFNSSLAHELLHWSLDHSTGDLDADHAGAVWGQVVYVDVALCEYLHPGVVCMPSGMGRSHADESGPDTEQEPDAAGTIAR